MKFPLVLEAEASHAHASLAGMPCTVEMLRLKTTLELGRFARPQYRNCLIDTGAFVSFIPFDAWNGLDGQIRWIARRDESSFPPWLRRIGGVTGGRLSTRLGRMDVRLTAFQTTGGMIQSPTIDLLAMFMFNPVAEPRILLGLHGGVAAIGRLVVEPGCAAAHFEV